jgi:hypothetical protein
VWYCLRRRRERNDRAGSISRRRRDRASRCFPPPPPTAQMAPRSPPTPIRDDPPRTARVATPAPPPRLAHRPPSRTAEAARWAERGRRAYATGGAGPPSYTTGLKTPAASPSAPGCRRAGANAPASWRVRHRAARCCEPRQRWLSPDPRAYGRSIADAVRSATRGAGGRSPNHARRISP